MVPSVIVIMLVLIPAIMSAIGMVREKETGSIANFRSTPITKFEFLVGKQFPYVVVGMLTFSLLMLMSLFVFHVPVKGSFLALALGTLLYIFSTSVSGNSSRPSPRPRYRRSSRRAVLSVIPAVNFSGLLVPVSSLSGAGRFIGLTFPAAWFQPISVGTFDKSLGFSDLWTMRWSLWVLRCFTSLPRNWCCRSRRPEMTARAKQQLNRSPRRRKEKRRRSGPWSRYSPALACISSTSIVLMIKEMRSIAPTGHAGSCPYTFTVAIYAAATGASTEATNLAVAIVDEDHSDLSRQIADGLTPPTFKPAVEISATEIDPSMDAERFLFVIEIPPKFQQDILAGAARRRFKST